MKLSEAIRLGSMLGPQLFHVSMDNNSNGSCALGAAYLAVNKDIARLMELFNEPLRGKFSCPCCNSGPVDSSFPFVMMHLNDSHKWSRERIADWVATIEPKDAEVKEVTEHDRQTNVLRQYLTIVTIEPKEEAKTEEVEQQELVCV